MSDAHPTRADRPGDTPSPGPPTARRHLLPRAHPVSWLMLLVTTGAVLITSIDRAILPAVLPGILSEFSLSESVGGVLVGLSFAGTAIGGLVIGIFGDSLGRGVRRAWAWAVAVLIVVVSAVLTAYSRSLQQLQVLRVVMGIGTGGMEPVNVTMVSEWWSKEHRGFAVGTHHTGFPIGQFVGTLLIGATVAVAGWRGSFLFIPLIAVPIVALQVVLARRRNLQRANDWMIEHDLTPSLTEDQLGRDARERPWAKAWEAVRAALGRRNVRLAVIANFLFLWAESGITAFLTVQLTQHAHMSLPAAVTASGASGILGWIGQIVWGTVSDHRGRKFSLGFLAVGWTVAVLAMIFISSPTSAWVILIAWGVVRNSPFPVMYAAVIDAVPEGASSGLGIMIGIGLGLSGLVAAPIAGVLIQHVGFTAHYLLIAGICLLTLVPIGLLRETGTGDR